MTLVEARKVTQIYGKYLEVIAGKLHIFFLARVPESFLPFPKKILEEAINIVAAHSYTMCKWGQSPFFIMHDYVEEFSTEYN